MYIILCVDWLASKQSQSNPGRYKNILSLLPMDLQWSQVSHADKITIGDEPIPAFERDF